MDPENPDTDGDGFTDGFELANGTDPADETSHTQNAFVANALAPKVLGENEDSDGDLVPDTMEQALKLNPRNADSDGDGLVDGAELLNQTDPREPSTHKRDSDKDGLFDATETRRGLNQYSEDTDRDELPDMEELLLQQDPKNPDSDGDGLIDGRDLDSREYLYAPMTIRFE